MKIEERKKTTPKRTYGSLKAGDVFSFVDYFIAAGSRSRKYLMCDEHVVDLQDYNTSYRNELYDWFIDKEHFDDMDERNWFEDSFDDREVIIYDATLLIEVDK